MMNRIRIEGPEEVVRKAAADAAARIRKPE